VTPSITIDKIEKTPFTGEGSYLNNEIPLGIFLCKQKEEGLIIGRHSSTGREKPSH